MKSSWKNHNTPNTKSVYIPYGFVVKSFLDGLHDFDT